MVTVVVSPEYHVVGEMEVIAGWSKMLLSLQLSCAWQIVGENNKKSMAAWRNDLELLPPFTQRLAHGCIPFVGWLRVTVEKWLGAIVTRLVCLIVTKE
jgi:hypothetical protein